jgi:hypothetical protein
MPHSPICCGVGKSSAVQVSIRLCSRRLARSFKVMRLLRALPIAAVALFWATDLAKVRAMETNSTTTNATPQEADTPSPTSRQSEHPPLLLPPQLRRRQHLAQQLQGHHRNRPTALRSASKVTRRFASTAPCAVAMAMVSPPGPTARALETSRWQPASTPCQATPRTRTHVWLQSKLSAA